MVYMFIVIRAIEYYPFVQVLLSSVVNNFSIVAIFLDSVFLIMSHVTVTTTTTPVTVVCSGVTAVSMLQWLPLLWT